jgi:hypothetical protein
VLVPVFVAVLENEVEGVAVCVTVFVEVNVLLGV